MKVFALGIESKICENEEEKATEILTCHQHNGKGCFSLGFGSQKTPKLSNRICWLRVEKLGLKAFTDQVQCLLAHAESYHELTAKNNLVCYPKSWHAINNVKGWMIIRISD